MRRTSNEGFRLRKPHLVIDFISVPPTIRAQSAVVYASVGKSVQLQCLATGPFDTKISWERMDNATTTKFRQQQHITGDLIRTNLYLKDIDKQDLGYYDCIAESISGRSQAKVELRGKEILFLLSRKKKIQIFSL